MPTNPVVPHREQTMALPTQPLRRTILVINPYGLHMRPATSFAALAVKKNCDVAVWNGEKRANGKSAWDLLSLFAEAGTQLILEVDGCDAAEALEELGAILANPGDPND